MAKALTLESIRRMARPAARRRLADRNTRGLYLIVEPSGVKRWVLRYKVGTDNGGRQYVYSLGPFGEGAPGSLDLDQARREAQAWRTRMKAGEYPHVAEHRAQELRDRERKLREEAPTVRDLGEWFEERYLKVKTKRPTERLRAFEKYIVPKLGTVKLAELRRADLNRALDEVVAQGRKVTAYQLGRLLGQMMRWAEDEELIESSPAERLAKGRPHTPRDRHLTDDEVRAAWELLDRTDIPMSAAVRIALKLLLLTGARAGEIAAARWSDVRFDGDMPQWTIPATAAKNARSHIVPLSKGAAGLFQRLHKLTGDTDYCLPAAERVRGLERLLEREAKPQAHVDSHAIATALRRTFEKAPALYKAEGREFTLAKFGAHDLRRTLRTGLSRLGYSAELAERVIGHTVRNALVATYDLYDRMPERREALGAWDREVQRVLANRPKVTNLRDRKRKTS